MISHSTSPKQPKLDAALPGQTQVTPLRRVVEAAVKKTEKDNQPRVLYLKTTAPSSDRTAQPYITTKFDSRHEDPQLRTQQSRKLKQTQHLRATAQLKDLTTSLLKLPSAPSTARRAAQDLDKLCTSDSTQLFGLPCTPELLEQLKRMESAQLAQRSTDSTPRQPPVRTPRSNADRPQPHRPTDEEESSTASQANVSKSEKSEDSSPPTTGGTPRQPRPSRSGRQPVKRAGRKDLDPIRKAYVDQQKQKRERQEQSLFDLQDLMFPDTPIQSPRTQPGTPTRPPQLPPSTSAPLIPALEPTEVASHDAPAPSRQLPPLPVGQGEPSGTESSGEPSPPAAQSDRPKSSVETIPMGSLQISKSQSTPTSPTPNELPPTSPRGLKRQPVPRFHRPSKLVTQASPTQPVTPRSPSANPASPTTETTSETPISEQ